jgi:WD40 repeat protein
MVCKNPPVGRKPSSLIGGCGDCENLGIMKKIFQTLLIFSYWLTFYAQGPMQPKLMLPIGHTDFVNAAVFSPDGKWTCTASSDKTAKIWDAVSGKLLLNLEGHESAIRSVSFSIDGKKILTASDDKTTKIWDAFTGKIILSLDGHSDAVNLATFSPSGNSILTASDDNCAKLWDAGSGELLFTLTGHKSDVNSAYFNADGNTILTASNDRTAKLWNAFNGKLITDFKGHTSKVRSAVFSPDGKKILTASWDSTAILWDADNGMRIYVLDEHKAEVGSAIFSPDGEAILTTSFDNTAKLWDTRTGKIKFSLNGHTRAIRHASFSSDQKKVLTASDDKTIKLWDAITGKLIFTLNAHESKVNSAGFSPDDKFILTASRDNTAKLWNAFTGSLLFSYEGHVETVNALQKTNQPDRILYSSWDNKTRIWDLNAGKLLFSLKGNAVFIDPAISHDGNTILTISYDESAHLWNFSTGKCVGTLQGKIDFGGFATFSPDGQTILAVSEKNNATIWRVKDGRLLSVLKGHDHEILFSRHSPDGNTILTADEAGILKLWNTPKAKITHSIKAHEGRITAASFNPDGTKIVTASWDGTAKLWDSKSVKLLDSFVEHSASIGSAIFSPEGNTMLTVSEDKTVKLWNVNGGKSTFTFGEHENSINLAQFSPDGRIILTASENKVNLWDAINGNKIKSIVLEGECMTVDFGTKKCVSHKNGMLTLWDLETGKKIYSLIAIDNEDYLVLLSDRYYMATSGAVSKIHYVLEHLQAIGFDQLDMKYNRPDKVHSVLGTLTGNPDIPLINSYHSAWLKRIRKQGIDTTAFNDGFSLPLLDIINREEIEFQQGNPEITFHLWGEDKENKLDRYNVWVNEVPVFGQRGISIKKQNINELKTSVTLTLSEGDNKIETSVLNVNGIESYRMPLYVRYNPSQPSTEKLHFVGIGVDRYQQPGHDLKYSAKDIRDLSKALKNKYGNTILIDTLFDENVTRENVLALKKKLKQTTVNDKVIVSFSGHGLLDSKFDYYLATHTVDFKNPSVSGLAYEDLEWLLDSIPARKKLLLMDACHSGEVDKEELLAIQTNKPEATRGAELDYEYAPTLGLKNSFELMQELFTNVNRGTGATVISASGGTQYAYEKGNLQNGVFTYSILELMQQKNEIKVSDLKSKVGERVTELTNGLQKPTSRQETIEFDWRVW